ncbi:tyrosine-type recombinase/integrase [Pandoraea commovens]|uniref:Integrase family protein n=1 Tax=Pandoraea commovens TaxID=2508289 RepID=A0ABY5QN85_9BURK|nr:integrase family protein [Pandoraea commovens]UVA82287.1 integrase family protein [Pandoraea commovens]
MAKINFTAARVERHDCPSDKVQSFLWDSRAPGLGLRATAGGAKTYVFQGKLHGRTLRLTLGDHRSVTIEQAQDEARRLQRLVTAGVDPRVDKAETLEARKRELEQRRQIEERGTLIARDAWNTYMAEPHEQWSDRHRLDHENAAALGGQAKKRGKGLTTAGPLTPLLALPLASIDAAVVREWVRKERAARETVAVNAFRKFRTFINWCAKSSRYAGIANPDCCRDDSVMSAVPKQRAKEHDCLQREQLVQWFNAVRSISNRVISAYLQGLLITGARREELAALRWADVDFQWRSLQLSDKVEEAGRTIPLTPYLSSLLAALPRRNEWVFSSPLAADGKLTEPRIAHTKALAVAGLPHVSLHGLRRSFGTLSEWCEVPVGVVAQIQGHKPSALAEKHYRRRPLDLLRMWHDKVEAWMLEQADIEFDAGVADKRPLQAVK